MTNFQSKLESIWTDLCIGVCSELLDNLEKSFSLGDSLVMASLSNPNILLPIVVLRKRIMRLGGMKKCLIISNSLKENSFYQSASKVVTTSNKTLDLYINEIESLFDKYYPQYTKDYLLFLKDSRITEETVNLICDIFNDNEFKQKLFTLYIPYMSARIENFQSVLFNNNKNLLQQYDNIITISEGTREEMESPVEHTNQLHQFSIKDSVLIILCSTFDESIYSSLLKQLQLKAINSKSLQSFSPKVAFASSSEILKSFLAPDSTVLCIVTMSSTGSEVQLSEQKKLIDTISNAKEANNIFLMPIMFGEESVSNASLISNFRGIVLDNKDIVKEEEWLSVLLADSILQTEMKCWKSVIEGINKFSEENDLATKETLEEFGALISYFEVFKTDGCLTVPIWRRGLYDSVKKLLEIIGPLQEKFLGILETLQAKKLSLELQIRKLFNNNNVMEIRAACSLWEGNNALHSEMMKILQLFLQSQKIWTSFLATGSQ